MGPDNNPDLVISYFNGLFLIMRRYGVRKRKWLHSLWLIVGLFILIQAAPTQAQEPAPTQPNPQQDKTSPTVPRPIALAEILAWKRITLAAVSPDGQWFACRISPNEGESEILVRKTREEKVDRFPVGEAPAFGDSADLVFSEDSRWLAFKVYPDVKEAKALRKDKKPGQTKVVLLNLATGAKTDYDKTKSFAFSGESAGWIALHKSASESQEKEKEKWSGSDLILRELATAKESNIGNVSEFSFDKKGLWLAWLVDAQGQSGNGLQVRNLTSGAVSVLDSDKAVYKGLNWREKGDALAVLKGKEDKAFEDKLYAVIGFSGLAAKSPVRAVYDPKEDKGFPEGLTVSPDRNPLWTEDLSGILFGIHEVKKKLDQEKKDEEKGADKDKGKDKEKVEDKDMPKDEVDAEDLPDLILWHWQDKRLQAQQQVEESRDKNFSFLCVYRIKEKKFIRLADDKLREVEAAPKERWAVGLDNSEYELMGSLDGREYQDVYAVDLTTGARRLAVKQCRWYFGPSPDGGHFLYYDDGHYHTYDLATGKSYNITEDVPSSFVNTESDVNVVKPPVYPIGWVKDGVSVLLFDNWDTWNVPVHSGKVVNLTVSGKKDGVRFRSRYRLDPEEKGVDLTGPMYLNGYEEWTKKAGIIRIDAGKPGPRTLLWDDTLFGRLLKAKKADVYLYTRETYKDYPDYYVTDGTLQHGSKITDVNPQQKDFLWSSGSRLIDYQSAKGDKLQAALFLPANYEKGKRYPTIVYIYEKLSQTLNSYFTPSARGFNKSLYTSQGYAVLMPDIVYQVNDPGMSAVWCVLPALDAAIAAGVVDKTKVGLQGHSWGGYQTAFLVTQTDAFAAAVAGAPLTNMISMYSSVYWNSGSANQPIFESSQGRFAGGYWENLEAYARNSPVYHAPSVKTPLIILHNDKDGAVDFNQGVEYFNTLRRLRKPVIMFEYVGENHGLQKPANMKDYTVRMLEFFDHYLMGKPAPPWLSEGVSYLKLKDHLKERVKQQTPAEEKEQSEK